MIAIKIIRDSLPARARSLMMCGFKTNGGVRGTSLMYKKKREMDAFCCHNPTHTPRQWIGRWSAREAPRGAPTIGTLSPNLSSR